MSVLRTDQKRLAKLDELFKLRLDRYIKLPIVIVVGDQSSGKSSVLEALIRFPLPQDASLCTRFPTNITFQRAPEEGLSISISPQDAEKAASDEGIKEFAAWAEEFKHPSQLKDGGFREILKRASCAMGLSGEEKDGPASRPAFSHDVLNISIRGPKYDHFGVVDLPGLFRRATKGVTTTKDIDYVRKLVARFMENPRAIILAVVPANTDTATQEITQLAETFDADRTRTLGVLTKLDIVDAGAEDHVIDLISKNASHKTLGYVAVRNKKQKEQNTSLDERKLNEDSFFNEAPWSDIPKDRAGIDALKKRVNQLMVEMSRKEFDNVLSDLELRLANAKEKSSRLSAPRDTSVAQRIFLTHAASRFYSLTARALDGYYARDDCFKAQSLRLATEIVRLHEAFANEMFRSGASRAFVAHEDDDSESTSGSEHKDGPEQSRADKAATEQNAPVAYAEAAKHDIAHLKTLFNIPQQAPAKRQKDIKTWIRDAYNASRGFELGMPNPNVVPSLFAEQVETWRYITMNHMMRIVSCLSAFMQGMLQAIFNDETLAEKVWRGLRPAVQEGFAEGIKHAEFLLSTELEGRPMTYNHYFADSLKKARAKREGRGPTEGEVVQGAGHVVEKKESNEDLVVDDIHDVLKAYHKVARKRFVDGICLQTVDCCLLRAPRSPLDNFSTAWVLRLSEAELDNLVGETEETKELRERLATEIADLEKGRDVLTS